MKRELIYRTDAMAAVGNLKVSSDTYKSKAMKAVLDVPAVQTCEDAVSRQAAIDAIAKFVPYVICDESTESYTNGLADAYNLICQLPSAQPQITRCAECIHWKHSDVRKNYCEVFDWMNTADDFCSFAERRSDE